MSTSGRARNTGEQLTHFIRKTVNYNDTNIGTSDKVKVGTLPAGAFIVKTLVRVETAFNAGTTNVLTVGTSGGSDADIVGASDVTEGSTGTVVVTTGNGLSITADTDVFAKYTQTGTVATTGKATIVIEYCPNNDG
jgi:hypothetical protein